MIIYDVTSRKSFENIELWLEDIDKYLHHKCILMLLGNKCDSSQREVPFEQGQQKAKQLDIGFMEISAKTGQNVEKGL